MRSAAEKLSAHMEHDFSNGGRKNRDFSPTNCEVKSISDGCLFRNPDYYFMLKKSQKKRIVFRFSGTLISAGGWQKSLQTKMLWPLYCLAVSMVSRNSFFKWEPGFKVIKMANEKTGNDFDFDIN